MLSGADLDFPDSCWDLLIPQANISLNLLQSARMKLKLSVYAMIYGNFDFDLISLAPPGYKIAIHDRANERKIWDEHARKGYYDGPAMQHYRKYQCYLLATKSTRVSNTVEFFLQNYS